MSSKLSFIDLFSGCGGFSLGMERAGFRCLAAIDFEKHAVEVLQKNLPSVSNVLERDLTKFRPEDLETIIGTRNIDVIVGGPPCQGFSTARQVDGSNHGQSRLKTDKRRLLFREFLRFVEFFQPKVFVIENVLGIRSAAGGEYFTRVQHEARNLGVSVGRPGYRVHEQIEDAQALGVPQKRRRQLIVGVRADIKGHFPTELACVTRATARTVLGTAIGDLPPVKQGGGAFSRGYDMARRRAHFAKLGKAARDYLYNVLEVSSARLLTGHVARPHNARDLRDFRRLREGESSAVAMRDRGVKFEFPYDKSSFKDRYTRQSRSAPCSTIVAHLSKDGLMFIHPTQDRSLTPREAARIQTFPDWFQFPAARTHAFRLIGNAVPPLVAEAVGSAIKSFLSASAGSKPLNENVGKVFHFPNRIDTGSAAAVRELASLSAKELAKLPKAEFLAAWEAIFSLFPNLHPQNGVDHGDQKRRCPTCAALFGKKTHQFVFRYLRSGWPVALEAAAYESWRRVRAGDLLRSEVLMTHTSFEKRRA